MFRGLFNLSKSNDTVTIKLVSNHEYCESSPDYQSPIGATHDDHTSLDYIKDLESYFKNRKIKYLELGCAGGRIVMDLLKRGHHAFGIEGTPYPRQIGRRAWKKYYQTNLFNCDLSKPFHIYDRNNNVMQFDVISHWEFIEHLPPSCLPYFISKLYTLLSPSGIICCGISSSYSPPHHQSQFSKEEWIGNYFRYLFNAQDYFFKHKLRTDGGSFYVILTKKAKPEWDVPKILEEYERQH